MKTQQVVQQLTREIKRNPAKAAVLGGLLVVAVWFWFPLIQGWFGSTDKVASKADTSIVVAQVDNSSSVTATPAGAITWKAIAGRMSEDPLMHTGTLRSETFDPFYPEQTSETQLTSTETAVEATPAPDVSPETAGLAVTSVITGSSHPIARINKLNYHVGDRIAVQDGQVTFTVLAVKDWGVLLQGQHRAYELHLEHNPLSAGNRMVMRNGTVISADN